MNILNYHRKYVDGYYLRLVPSIDLYRDPRLLDLNASKINRASDRLFLMFVYNTRRQLLWSDSLEG